MFTRALLVILLLAASAPFAAAQARPVKEALGGLTTELAPSHPRLSPEEAAREIQRRHGGRVLSVQSDGRGYRVKMLKGGEVRIYQINP